MRVQIEEQVELQDEYQRRIRPAALIAVIAVVTLLGGYPIASLADGVHEFPGVEAREATSTVSPLVVTPTPTDETAQAAGRTALHRFEENGDSVGGESRDAYDWLMVVGPFAGALTAVLIAAFGPSMRRLVRHPVLRVSIDQSDRDDCHKTQWAFDWSRLPVAECRPEDSAVQTRMELLRGTAHTSSDRPVHIIRTASTATQSSRGDRTVSVNNWADSSRAEAEETEKRGQGEEFQRIDVYYLRLKVHNDGNERAEEVEVYASELRKQHPDDGTFSRVESFQSMNLVWSHYRAPFLSAISPKTHKHCDLAHLTHPTRRELVGEDVRAKGIGPGLACLAFDTAVTPNNRGNIVGPGTYELDITVAAANADPVPVTVDITVTGKWEEHEDVMLGQEVKVGVSGRRRR